MGQSCIVDTLEGCLDPLCIVCMLGGWVSPLCMLVGSVGPSSIVCRLGGLAGPLFYFYLFVRRGSSRYGRRCISNECDEC